MWHLTKNENGNKWKWKISESAIAAEVETSLLNE